MGAPVLSALQVADAAAFLTVGVLAVRGWWRDRDHRRACLAIALACLGVVALGLAAEATVGPDPWLTTTVITFFAASGAGLLFYRSSILRLPRWVLALGVGDLVGAIIVGLAAGLPDLRTLVGLTGFRLAAVDALLVAWCLTVIEPAYRLARLSAQLPPVQRARAQSLAAGYGGIVVVAALTLIAVALGTSQLSLVLLVVALLCVPLLYVGLTPPRWLRWVWRRAEEVRLRGAIHDLLLATPDRAAFARRSLDWAIRLVGAEAGLVADWDGELLALQGLDHLEAQALIRQALLSSGSSLLDVEPGPRAAIAQRLPVQSGTGLLVVASGALSPAFGDDEVEWLSAYAASMAIALDRARVAELMLLHEAELRRARDLAETANQAKSEFLSRMSHELRTPLTAVIGFADLLLMDERDEQRTRHLASILSAGEHLLALINDVMDIARIEEGRFAVSLERVDAVPLVNEVVELTRAMAAQNDVAVSMVAMPQGLSVIADRRRLKQVLVNIVSNALKYNRRGGLVEIGSVPADGQVRITVRDTGLGLRPEEIRRLFSPFERLSAAAAGIEGTGLGLAVSKSLAEAMGCRVGVDSTPGIGSTFWVELRAWEVEAVDDASEDAGEMERPRVELSPSLVLYVEDTASNVRLVERVIARRPELTLMSVSEGRRALEAARERHPDLILLDVHLPDIDGMDVLEQLMADAELARVPVVVLSADATERRAERFLAAGAREYLTKPIRVSQLLQVFDRNLRPAATLAVG